MCAYLSNIPRYFKHVTRKKSRKTLFKTESLHIAQVIRKVTVLAFRYKGNRGNVTDSVGLLISILVRYPEVATINFDPENHLLKFTFIYSQSLGKNELDNLHDKLMDSIEVYNLLEGKEPKFVSLNHQVCSNLTMIEIQRDVDTLVQEEITLIVNLFHQYLHNNLVTEDNEQLVEEDLIAQDELIEHMLENIKCSKQEKSLFAFREEGRVLVFNK
ncbi:hypothetical protein Psfp_01239 [Pelotomaculum sp. FP]|nr:hypothetical protein Psfp_01239 [Pelotomaculum sp. FP]